MPPKKNAFMFFLDDWVAEQRKKGFICKTLQDAVLLCSPDWESLDPTIRKKYKVLADEAKAQRYQLKECHDEVQSEFDKREGKVPLETEIQIRKTVECLTRIPHALDNCKFYLIHANYYVYWKEFDKFIPSEVAIAEFSFDGGLTNVIHFFPEVPTDDGRLPPGYASDADYRCQNIHGLYPNNYDRKAESYLEMYSKIKSFLSSNLSGVFPPLYTMADNEKLNHSKKCVLDFIHQIELASPESDAQFAVYDALSVFSELDKFSRKNESRFSSVMDVKVQLERDPFKFAQGLACDFHSNVGSWFEHNCSLSIVKRWSFFLSGENPDTSQVRCLSSSVGFGTVGEVKTKKSTKTENNETDIMASSSSDDLRIVNRYGICVPVCRTRPWTAIF